MSQEQIQLVQKTQQLLHGPLKHVRAAALAAALLPLASVAATSAQAQELCPSGGTCGTVQGTVFYDANNDGIQNGIDAGISDAVVTVTVGGVMFVIPTNDGSYSFDVLLGTYTVVVQIPPGAQPSPGTIVCMDDSTSVCASVVSVENSPFEANFGFSQTTVFPNPGTGTPGYWKNHPEAWPVDSITIGYITLEDGTKGRRHDILEN